MVGAERLRLGERRGRLLLEVVELGVERLVERHLDHVDRLDDDVAGLGQPDGRRDHLLADLAELHRHEDPREARLGELLLVRRDDVLEQARAAAAAHHHVHDEARSEPCWAAVARAEMRHQRDDEDRRRAKRAEDGRQREDGAAETDAERDAERAPRVGLRHAEPDHRELRGGEGEQHPEAEEAREERHLARERGADQERDGDAAGRDHGGGCHERAAMETAEGRGQLSVLAERVGEPSEAGDRRRRCGEQHERPGQADVDAKRPGEPVRQMPLQRGDDAHQGRAQPVGTECRRPVRRRVRRETDQGDQDVDDDDQADRAEQAARQVPAGAAHLLRVVRDGLEPRVREHGQRQRERDLVPRRMRAEREAAGQRRAGEEEREAEDHEQDLRDQVEDRHRDAEGVEAGPSQQPRRGDRRDDDAPADHVARSRRDRSDPERQSEVVRHEERRERDHDQVVEEERPAREESREVVEGDADEGRGAARLADRRRPFGV